MAIVANKSRPVAVTDTLRSVEYDDTNEVDVHLSTTNTDILALFQANMAMRTTDDRGNPDTGALFANVDDLPVNTVTYNGDPVTHNNEVVTHG